MKWLELLKALGPVVLSTIPGVPPVIIPVVIHAIETAEGTFKPGADKKGSVLAVAVDAVTITNSVSKKEVIGPDVIPAVSKGIDAVIGAVNAVKKQS